MPTITDAIGTSMETDILPFEELPNIKDDGNSFYEYHQ